MGLNSTKATTMLLKSFIGNACAEIKKSGNFKLAGVLCLKLNKKATIVTLAFGFMGEGCVMPAYPAFYVGMAGWFFLLFEIFGGEAGGAVKDPSPACIGTAIYSAPFFSSSMSGRLQLMLFSSYTMALPSRSGSSMLP